LIKLDRLIDISKASFYSGKDLVTSGQEYKNYKKCHFAGWGASNYKIDKVSKNCLSTFPGFLKDMNVEIHANNSQADWNNNSFCSSSKEKKTFCTLFMKPITSAAGSADSGGPLVCRVKKHDVIVGIERAGPQCKSILEKDHKSWITLFTDVAVYAKWISDNVNDLKNA